MSSIAIVSEFLYNIISAKENQAALQGDETSPETFDFLARLTSKRGCAEGTDAGSAVGAGLRVE